MDTETLPEQTYLVMRHLLERALELRAAGFAANRQGRMLVAEERAAARFDEACLVASLCGFGRTAAVIEYSVWEVLTDNPLSEEDARTGRAPGAWYDTCVRLLAERL